MFELLKGRNIPVTLLAVVLLLSLLAGGAFADNGDDVQVVYWENDDTGLRYLWFFQDTEPYVIDEDKTNPTMGGIGMFGAGEWYIIGAGDLNDDGNADIVWYNVQTGLVYYWLMDRLPSRKWLEEGGYGGIGETDAGWAAVAVADMNGNGKLDIVLQHEDGRLGVWWLGGVEYQDYAVFDGHEDDSMEVAAVADMNGDGNADILWQNDQGDREIWLMDDELGVDEEIVPEWDLDNGWEIAAVGDFNGNGHNDIIWQQMEEGDDFGLRYVWYMDGLDRVSSKGIGTVADAAWNLVALATTAGVEDEPDEIVFESMEPFDEVEVPFGTSEEDAIAELATSTVIYGTQGEEGVATVDLWRLCDNYSTTTADTYMATATLIYPDNWVDVQVEATTTVTVLPETLVVVSVEAVEATTTVPVGTPEAGAIAALNEFTVYHAEFEDGSTSTIAIDDWAVVGTYDNSTTTVVNTFEGQAQLEDNWVFAEGVDGTVTGYVVIGVTLSELAAITKDEFFKETLM